MIVLENVVNPNRELNVIFVLIHVKEDGLDTIV